MSQPCYSFSVEKVDVVKTIEKVDIVDVVVKPFDGATISVFLRTAGGEFIRNETVVMSKEEYLLWLNDDSFLVSFVLEKLGFTEAEPLGMKSA